MTEEVKIRIARPSYLSDDEKVEKTSPREMTKVPIEVAIKEKIDYLEDWKEVFTTGYSILDGYRDPLPYRDAPPPDDDSIGQVKD